MCGASLVMPGRFLQAEPLTRMVKEERVTFSGAVPTIWADILRYGEDHEIDLSSMRTIVCGGSAVPRSLIERFHERYDVRHPPGLGHDRDVAPRRGVASARRRASRARPRRSTGGRAPAGWSSGVELRIVDDVGNPLAVGRRSGRRDRGARAVDHGRLLRRPVAREVRRRLAAHRRRRHRSTPRGSCRSPTGPRT